MKELFKTLQNLLISGKPAMLLTVVESSGSTPAGLGASMVVDESGRKAGTIGGGAVEYMAEKEALIAIKNGNCMIKEYSLRHSEAGDIGMVCGGDVCVYFCYMAPSELAIKFIQLAINSFNQEENTWFLMELNDKICQLAIYSKSLGLCTMEKALKSPFSSLSAESLQKLLSSTAVQKSFNNLNIYSLPLVRAGRAVVFGGGHVAQALVPILTGISFRTVVYDDRPEFANPGLFPTANEIVVGSFNDIEHNLKLSCNDWLVVLTRGHAADFEVQRQVLNKNFAYVGVIGSSAKTKAVNARLLAGGLSLAAINAVYTPIGLAIGAKTPAEIAVAIAAQMIEIRNR